MTNPAKNRLHDYEAGWLTLLVEMGVATKQEAHDASSKEKIRLSWLGQSKSSSP